MGTLLREQPRPVQTAVRRAAKRVVGVWYKPTPEELDFIFTDWAMDEGALLGDVSIDGYGITVHSIDEDSLWRAAQKVLLPRLEETRRGQATEADMGFREKVGVEPKDERERRLREEAEEEQKQRIEKTLETIEEKGPQGRTRAALIRMHLGQRVVPGQPPELINTRYYDRKEQEWVTLYGQAPEDFGTYHGLIASKSGSCPTCKAIMKFYRIPGLDLEILDEIMKSFAIRIRAV